MRKLFINSKCCSLCKKGKYFIFPISITFIHKDTHSRQCLYGWQSREAYIIELLAMIQNTKYNLRALTVVVNNWQAAVCSTNYHSRHDTAVNKVSRCHVNTKISVGSVEESAEYRGRPVKCCWRYQVARCLCRLSFCWVTCASIRTGMIGMTYIFILQMH